MTHMHDLGKLKSLTEWPEMRRSIEAAVAEIVGDIPQERVDLKVSLAEPETLPYLQVSFPACMSGIPRYSCTEVSMSIVTLDRSVQVARRAFNAPIVFPVPGGPKSRIVRTSFSARHA